MNSQNWNAEEYSANAAFVAQLGNSILGILAPKAGERILDVGCGDGKLTLEIQNYSCHVLGIDSSEEMINATRKLGIEGRVISGDSLNFAQEFDAVFSNAALHWMLEKDQVAQGVYQALKPGGRLNSEEQEFFINAVEKRLKPMIFSEEDGWVADYMRLRFKALK